MALAGLVLSLCFLFVCLVKTQGCFFGFLDSKAGELEQADLGLGAGEWDFLGADLPLGPL